MNARWSSDQPTQTQWQEKTTEKMEKKKNWNWMCLLVFIVYTCTASAFNVHLIASVSMVVIIFILLFHYIFLCARRILCRIIFFVPFIAVAATHKKRTKQNVRKYTLGLGPVSEERERETDWLTTMMTTTTPFPLKFSRMKRVIRFHLASTLSTITAAHMYSSMLLLLGSLVRVCECERRREWNSSCNLI